MISAIGLDYDGKRETLRMTTRAMMAIEDHFDAGVLEVFESIEENFRMGTIVRLLSECANDGAGAPLAHAQMITDVVGIEVVAERVTRAVEVAFPDTGGEGDDQPGKSPGKTKKPSRSR